MKAIYKKRLLNVAKALRESKRPEAFDMAHYGYGEDDAHPCGTPACALGHYAARADLQRAFCLDLEYGNVLLRGGGSDMVWFDDSNVCDHFGLSFDEASELFSGRGCAEATTPKQAARYIERFVARKEKESRK